MYPNGGIDGKCFVSHRLHIHFPVKKIKQQAEEANRYHAMTLSRIPRGVSYKSSEIMCDVSGGGKDIFHICVHAIHLRVISTHV